MSRSMGLLVFKEEFGFRTLQAGDNTKYSNKSYDEEALMLTGDLNVLNVSWIVHFKIKDPVHLLFNVCDPVVCPSSRCDLGGTYPVKDVVQSGIIGSLALCLPNFPEVKVPICLSGVHAGIEAYLSVAESYQQCLQTSLFPSFFRGILHFPHTALRTPNSGSTIES